MEDTRSRVKSINTMDFRVKHQKSIGGVLSGHFQPMHSSKDSMQGGFIAAGPSSSRHSASLHNHAAVKSTGDHDSADIFASDKDFSPNMLNG